MRLTIKRLGGGVTNLAKDLAKNAQRRVLIGYPAGTVRDTGVSQALIAAIHEFGSISQGISARPFLVRGVFSGRPIYKKAVAESYRSEMLLILLGAAGSGAVKSYLVSGEFRSSVPPLAPATLRARERKAGRPLSTSGNHPLIDTGSLRQSCTFVIES